MGALFRDYRPDDRDQCVALLTANTPEFFAPEEKADYEEFLDSFSGPYFVIEDQGRVIGAGGYLIEEESRIAGIRWGMLDPQEKSRGLGRFLLEQRIKRIRESGQADRICVQTSQMTAPFFHHLGFIETKREADKIAKGIDEVELWLEL